MIIDYRLPSRWLMLLSLACSSLASEIVLAEAWQLQTVSVRARVSGTTTLGKAQPEEFQEYDIAASFRRSGLNITGSGWEAGIRLIASAGLLRGVGKNALVVSLLPVLSIGSADGRYMLDAGVGVGLLSRHRFGRQDYGAPSQFALTLGASVPLYKSYGLGYRFMHYSDAGIHGSDTIGADFHMIELLYSY